MRTVLWAARLERELTEAEHDTMLALLPPARRERLLRVREPARRREALCAWVLLRKALYEELGWEELPETALTERGKPYFPDHSGVCFSLSHTEGAVLIGLSDAPLGVDIEKFRPVRERVMRTVPGVETAEEFLRRWTVLEALGKRSGEGVFPVLSEHPESGEENLSVPVFPGYAAAAAFSPGRRADTVKIFVV